MTLGLQAGGVAQLARGDVVDRFTSGAAVRRRRVVGAADRRAARGQPARACARGDRPPGRGGGGGPARAGRAPRMVPPRPAARDRPARHARDRAPRGRRHGLVERPAASRARTGRRRVARGGAGGARLGAPPAIAPGGSAPGRPETLGERSPSSRRGPVHLAFPVRLAGGTEARWGVSRPTPSWAPPVGGRGPDARVATARDAPRLRGHHRSKGQAHGGAAHGSGGRGAGACPRDLRGLGRCPDRIGVLLLAAAVRLAAGGRATALADLRLADAWPAPGGYVRPLRGRWPARCCRCWVTRQARRPTSRLRIRAAPRGDEAPRGPCDGEPPSSWHRTEHSWSR